MKKIINYLSSFLVVTMLTSCLQISVYAKTSQVKSNVSKISVEKPVEKSSKKESEILKEIVEKRGNNTKHFLMDDLTFKAVVYPQAVHYLENGEWKDIDNNLVEDNTEEKGFGNKQNDFKVKFTNKATSKKLVNIQKGKYGISWNIENANETEAKIVKKSEKNKKLVISEINNPLEKNNSNIEYPNIFKGVDLQYVLNGESLKENIILKERVENISVSFNLNVKNLIPKIQKDNSIVFYDNKDSNKAIFTIAAPFMYDAKNQRSDDVKVKLDSNKNDYKITITPNKEWLKSVDRSWPVVIDPPIESMKNTTKYGYSECTYVDSYYPNFNYGQNEAVYVGSEAGKGIQRTLLKIGLPSLSTGDVVTSSNLYVSLNKDISTERAIAVHELTQDYYSSAVKWSNQPDYNNQVEDYIMAKGVAGDELSFDITKSVKRHKGNSSYGLLLKSYEEDRKSTPVSISGMEGYPPYITISYINTTGIENYWSYHTQEAGRAGNGYVNDFSGNIVFIHDDLTMNGNRMPAVIKHVYNSNDKYVNLGYGAGWRLNFSQKIVPETIANVQHFKYIDDDGTTHYFKYFADSNEYKDMSGLDLKLTVDSNSIDERYKMNDKNGSFLTFKANGCLFKISDNNNNSITLNYTGEKLTGLTDGVGRITSLAIDANGRLLSITDLSGRITSYNYTGSQLTGITYPDGKSISYAYNLENQLISATNIDGYKVQYIHGYNSKTIQESDINGSIGKEIISYYGYNTTYFTDVKGRVNIYQFNNKGNTVSIRDDQGRTAYYKYSGASNNKLELESNLQKSMSNYILNHNAEVIDKGWEFSNGTNSVGTGSYTASASYSGNQSILINKGNDKADSLMKQKITLVKGETYTLSAYVKTDSVTSNTGKGAALQIGYFDNAGKWNTEQSSYVNGTKDWDRIDVTFTVPTNINLKNEIYAQIGTIGESGKAYFDCMQLEEGSVSKGYNLVENGDLIYLDAAVDGLAFWNEANCDWTGEDSYGQMYDEIDEFATIPGKHCIYINGHVGEDKYIYQDINISGIAGDSFVVGGWAKANSLPLKENVDFALEVGFKDNEGQYHWSKAQFNVDSAQYQFISDYASTDVDYTSIQVRFLNRNNLCTTYFGGMQLFKESFGTAYSHDTNGNVSTVGNGDGSQLNYGYDTNNNVVDVQSEGEDTSNFEYDSRHNLLKSISGEVVSTYTYDSYGNTKTAKTGDDTNFIQTSTEYTTNGNYVKSEIDSLGNITTLNYDETKGLVNSVVDPENAKTSYSYDANTDNLKSVSVYAYGIQVTNSYGYENDRLKNITTQNGVNYNFAYNLLGMDKSVSVGNQNLITNNYETVTANLLSSDYGNGEKVGYDFDNKDRVTAQKYNDSIINRYEYYSDGKLDLRQDLVNCVTYKYSYDLQGNLSKVTDSKGNEQIYQTDYSNNSSSTKEIINGINYTTTYSNNTDNNPKQVVMNSGAKLDYSYDSLSRLASKNISTGSATLNTIYNYTMGANGSQSSQLSSIDNNGDKISYTYYNDGNINTITRNGKQIKYYYNNLKEVTREDNQELNKTIIYVYDLGGNLTNRKEYLYNSFQNLTRSILYQYNDTNWKDKLTNYDGKAITYDSIGNPLTYDGYSYAWENGRQLKSMTKTGLNLSFKYNDAGIRTEKTVNGKVTSYHLEGDKVTFETDGTDKIYYTYDSGDKLVSMSLNGVEYYYIRNAQGDIIGLVDNLGTQVVGYTYDSWGKLISTTGALKDTVGVKNPYLYRGYRYDKETGLYYLQSRYYNADWERFVNADDTSVLQAQKGVLLGSNMFAYCMNNPVMNFDPSGYIPANAIAAAIGAFTSVFFDMVGQALAYYLKNNFNLRGFKINWWSVGFAFAAGLVTGALMVSNLKQNTQAVFGGIIGLIQGFVTETASARQQGRSYDYKQPLIGCVFGVVSGYFGQAGQGRAYLRGKGLWTPGHYLIAGKRYNKFPARMIFSRGFGSSFIRYIGGNLFSMLSKGL